MNLREQQSPIYLRFFRRVFHTKRSREEMERSLLRNQEEEIQTPFRMVINRFFSNKIALSGLLVFCLLMGGVIILPFFYPLQKSYQEVTQQNIPPGQSLMKVPNKLENDTVQISVGATYSVGINHLGELFLWGSYPASIGEIPEDMGRIKKISAGMNHVLALNENGELFAWGSNRFHQCEIPEEVQKLDTITQLLAGNQISIVVTKEGEVYFWGNRNLLDFDTTAYQGHVKEVAANTSVVLGLLDDGTVAVLGRRESAFSKLPKMTEIKEIALTSQMAYALKNDGTLYQWGNEIPDTKVTNQIKENGESIVTLETGRYHITVLSNAGNAYSWGQNTYGQTEVSRSLKKQAVTAIYAGYYQNYAVTESGEIVTWGLKGYLMGTDGYGRDIFTRLVNGGRLTMTIGAVAVLIQTVIGILIGGIAGYYGGRIDNLLMRITEVVNSLPFLPFAMILSALIGNRLSEMQRIYMIMIVLGVLSWPGMARLVRAQVLTEKSREFVTAAKAVGIPQFRIVFRHILPNVMSYVIVSATSSFAASMLTESSLSFLGFGVMEPSPTWGNMLTGSQSSTVIGTYWWRWVFAALALSLATISINLIGDGLRNAIDPKSGE